MDHSGRSRAFEMNMYTNQYQLMAKPAEVAFSISSFDVNTTFKFFDIVSSVG